VSERWSSGLLSRELVLSLYLPATMLALGQSMVAPVIPGLTRSYGVGLAEASLVFVAAGVGAVAATVPSGYLMDRVGRRPVMLAGPILTAIGSAMTPFAHSFPELLFWRFLVGASDQMWQQSRLLMIVDTAHPTHRARQLQWMMGMMRAGQLLGPSMGGLLAEAFAIWVPFALHAGLTLIAIIPSFRLARETAPGRRGHEGETASQGAQGWRPVLAYMLSFQVLVFLAIQFTAQLARGGQEQGSLNLYATYAYGMSPGELGRLNSVAAAVSLPVPFLTGYFMDRFGRRAVIGPGFAAYAGAIALMSLTAFFPLPVSLFLASYVLVQGTLGTTNGTMQVLGADLSPSVNRGRFFALWRMVAQMGIAVSPAAFAFVAEHVSYGLGFIYLAACSMVVCVLVSRVLGETRLARLDDGLDATSGPDVVDRVDGARERKAVGDQRL
jgi:MFS family permease